MIETKILLVGEAWGMKEQLFEHAFVGPSGAELARMLSEAGIASPLAFDNPSELEMIKHWKKLRENEGIDIANVFNYHPEDNKIELCFTNRAEGVTELPPLKAGKFLRPDLLSHVEQLWQKIEEQKPNLIIALGNIACWALLGETKITAIRGTVKISPKLNIKVLPTYHPAYILRQWAARPIAVTDFQKALREADFTDIKRIERWITIEPTIADIASWFQRPAAYYATDIETSVKKNNEIIAMRQITMIGFARSPFDALVIPFVDINKPGWSYWQTEEEEIEVWRLIDNGLKRPVPKIFQNGVFDLSYILRAKLRPTMCQEDTMLFHHSLYPEMLKGLGFLGSIYSEEISWKQMRTKGDNLKRDE